MKQKVVVVGAGLAGLTAAYELSKRKNLEVTLIDARDRIGGRVYADKVNGITIDFGGFIIYDWYKNYRKYCKELKIKKQLANLPKIPVLYDFGDGEFVKESHLGFSFATLFKLALKFFPEALFAGGLVDPNFHHFKGKTIEQYIEELEPKKDAQDKFKLLFDTISQGYCYAPMAQYYAAFGVPIYPKVILQGGLDDSDIFVHGSSELPNAFAEAIKKNGGRILLGQAAQSFDGDSISTNKGIVKGDKFIFALPANQQIYRDLLPKASSLVDYTTFLTATFESEKPYLDDEREWGAIFYAVNKGNQVLSLINLEALYGSKKLKNHYTVNIKIPGKNELSEKEMISSINRVLNCENRIKSIKKFEHWPEAMPISYEEVVKLLQSVQGINNSYYAGDFLGCPSMETAVTTGMQAADKLLKDL